MASSTVFVPRERLERWLDNFAIHHGAPRLELSDDELSLHSPDGARAWMRIPYGPVRTTGDPRADVLTHLATDRVVGVLLARRGGHAAGVFHGDQLIASKVGSSYVQGRTKAGGWSQQRYSRRRANQATQAAAKAADDAVRILVPQLTGEPEPLQALMCGGDRAMCEQVLADPRLSEVAQLWQPRVVHPVPDPRLRTLRDFGVQCFGVRAQLNDEAVLT